ESAPGDWHAVTQTQINAFAETTLDEQFIHVNPERAARESPFGKPIAHGFFTLSLLVHLSKSIPSPGAEALAGRSVGINYGFDRWRFPAPVPVDSQMRAGHALIAVEPKDERTLQLPPRVTVETGGQSKPACAPDWISPPLSPCPPNSP